jgi:hypothetical protein
MRVSDAGGRRRKQLAVCPDHRFSVARRKLHPANGPDPIRWTGYRFWVPNHRLLIISAHESPEKDIGDHAEIHVCSGGHAGSAVERIESVT